MRSVLPLCCAPNWEPGWTQLSRRDWNKAAAAFAFGEPFPLRFSGRRSLPIFDSPVLIAEKAALPLKAIAGRKGVASDTVVEQLETELATKRHRYRNPAELSPHELAVNIVDRFHPPSQPTRKNAQYAVGEKGQQSATIP